MEVEIQDVDPLLIFASNFKALDLYCNFRVFVAENSQACLIALHTGAF